MNKTYDEDTYMQDLIRTIIQQSNARKDSNPTALALLMFLVRTGNSWRSIRTLLDNTEDAATFSVDVGTLLRAMYDAYLQAAWICRDPSTSNSLAQDYIDFEHVERFNLMRAVLRHETPLTRRIRASPGRDHGEPQLNEKYDQVKGRYLKQNKNKGGNANHRPSVRNIWYRGTLADVASKLGSMGEYDFLVRHLHGCVHSSSLAVQKGPLVPAEHQLHWASKIFARVAVLSVKHNQIVLDETIVQVLDVLSNPDFK